MRSARYVLAAVAACLLMATPAQAAWKHDRALAIAQSTWGHPCERVSLSYETHIDWEPWWAYSDGCDEVVLNDDPPVPWVWAIYCTALIHELGHAAGQPHSENPRAVMYPTVGYVIVNGEVANGANWRCRDRGRPFLESHGLLAPLPARREPRRGMR